MFNKKGITSVLLLIVATTILQAWNISSDYTVEWDTRTIYLDITAYREESDPFLPAARQAAESAIERALPLLCLDMAAEIQADSRKKLGDIMEKNKIVLASLRDIHLKTERGSSSFTEDFSGLRVRYSLDMFPALADPLIHHERPFKIERRLDWEPTGPFTGIIIYARGELPEHGKSGTARMVPCLLPSIYDQEMNLLSAPYMTDPEMLLRRGPVAYVYSLKDKRIPDRVGYYPMRIAARAVFGTRPTDPIIPLEWGDKIRASREIQKLIADGKVIIVIDRPTGNPTSLIVP